MTGRPKQRYTFSVMASSSNGVQKTMVFSIHVQPAQVSRGWPTTGQSSFYAFTTTATRTGGSGSPTLSGVATRSSGLGYYEVAYSSNNTSLRVGGLTTTFSAYPYLNAQRAVVYCGGKQTEVGPQPANGVVGVARNFTNTTIGLHINGVWVIPLGSTCGLSAGSVTNPMASSDGVGQVFTLKTSGTFAYAPPAGYSAWDPNP